VNPLLSKEVRLVAPPITYLFVGFSAMALLPGYPVLCSAFFVSLGIFHAFRSAREANDLVFSALLPIAKRDVVKGKLQFVLLIELISFAAMAVLVLVRMTVLADAAVYRHNALMNANPFFLGAVLLLFGLFNALFVGRLFRDFYKMGRCYVVYIAAASILIVVAETLHHLPGLGVLNAFGFDYLLLQVALLVAGAVLFALMTFLSYKRACRDFEMADL